MVRSWLWTFSIVLPNEQRALHSKDGYFSPEGREIVRSFVEQGHAENAVIIEIENGEVARLQVFPACIPREDIVYRTAKIAVIADVCLKIEEERKKKKGVTKETAIASR